MFSGIQTHNRSHLQSIVDNIGGIQCRRMQRINWLPGMNKASLDSEAIFLDICAKKEIFVLTDQLFDAKHPLFDVNLQHED